MNHLKLMYSKCSFVQGQPARAGSRDPDVRVGEPRPLPQHRNKTDDLPQVYSSVCIVLALV